MNIWNQLACQENKKINLKSQTVAKSLEKGFTIIELMIVIVIIATLASIAVPSFKNYTARAKVTEALSAASSAKVLIAEEYLNNNMPNDGFSLPNISTKYVQGLSYERQDDNHGFIRVSTRNLGAGLDDGLSFGLFAKGDDAGIDWDCAMVEGSEALPADYLPTQCRDESPTVNSAESYFD